MLNDGDLTLQPITPEDLPAMYAWSIDVPTHLSAEIRALLPTTWERFLARAEERTKGPDRADFTVTVECRQVGVAQMAAFDHLARSATIGITIAPAERGRHYGRRAVRLLVDHGFRDRGLHRIALETGAENVGGQRAYESVGFVKETLERERTWIDGRYTDGMRMSILRPEWEAARARG